MAEEWEEGEELRLVGYEISEHTFEVRPAPLGRDWMDATRRRIAYRCLPLSLANQLGWELLCPVAFSACWGGGEEDSSIRLRFHGEKSDCVISHFGRGILSFRVQTLFRTPPGHNLWVSGPANRIKDGIAALEGLVETDWTPATFTMNWKFTRPGHEVRFAEREPIARILPYPRNYAERFSPELRPLRENPELRERYRAWRDSRDEFLTNLEEEGSDESRRRWQGHYFRGSEPAGGAFEQHQTKLVLKPFRRRTQCPGRKNRFRPTTEEG
jgi:hypothetical protein